MRNCPLIQPEHFRKIACNCGAFCANTISGSLGTNSLFGLSKSMMLCFLSFTPTHLYAQASLTETTLSEQVVEEIIVIDTRLDANTYGIGENLTIDSSSLSSIQAADAELLFQRLPGFSVSRPGGPGGVSEIFQRGAESNFTAVYVDGVRLNNSSNTRGGSFDFSFLEVSGVERIDVASGAMSAIYGADAMAGVVHIRSAWAAPGTSTAFAEAGTADLWRTGIGTSISVNEETDLSLRASAMNGGNEIEGSSLRVDNIATRLRGKVANLGSWELGIRFAERERTSFPEISGGPELAILRDLEFASGDELAVSASISLAPTDNWTSDLHLSTARLRDDAFVPAVAPGTLSGQPSFTSITDYNRTQLTWVNHSAVSPSLGVVSGIDIVKEDGSDTGAIDFGIMVPNAYEIDRSVYSAFGEIGKQWNHGIVSSAAIRWDHSDSEKRFSGKIGIEKSVSENGSHIWVRIANGFKLPSFFALGNPLFGNPDLLAEKVRNSEIGYTHAFNNGNQLIVTAYRNRFDDLVDFDFENFTNVNAGRFDVNGVELRTSIQLAQTLQLLVDGNWSDISYDDEPLRRRPEKTGGATLDWTFTTNWYLNTRIQYIGSRLITSIPTGDIKAPGFTILSATARFEPSNTYNIWLAIDNALNEAYQDAPGFASPGTRARLGLRVNF